jgi:hypothetical protein
MQLKYEEISFINNFFEPRRGEKCGERRKRAKEYRLRGNHRSPHSALLLVHLRPEIKIVYVIPIPDKITGRI